MAKLTIQAVQVALIHMVITLSKLADVGWGRQHMSLLHYEIAGSCAPAIQIAFPQEVSNLQALARYSQTGCGDRPECAINKPLKHQIYNHLHMALLCTKQSLFRHPWKLTCRRPKEPGQGIIFEKNILLCNGNVPLYLCWLHVPTPSAFTQRGVLARGRQCKFPHLT